MPGLNLTPSQLNDIGHALRIAGDQYRAWARSCRESAELLPVGRARDALLEQAAFFTRSAADADRLMNRLDYLEEREPA